MALKVFPTLIYLCLTLIYLAKGQYIPDRSFLQPVIHPSGNPFSQPYTPQNFASGSQFPSFSPNPVIANPQNVPQNPNFNPLPSQIFPPIPDPSSLLPQRSIFNPLPPNQQTTFPGQNPVLYDPTIFSQRPNSGFTNPQSANPFYTATQNPDSTFSYPLSTNPFFNQPQQTSPFSPQQTDPFFNQPQQTSPFTPQQTDRFFNQPQQTNPFSPQPTALLSSPPQINNPSTLIYETINPQFSEPQQTRPSYTSPQETILTSPGLQQTNINSARPQEFYTDSTSPQQTNSDLAYPQNSNTDTTISQPTNSGTTVPQQTDPDLILSQPTNSDVTVPRQTDTGTTNPQITEAISGAVQPIASASEPFSSVSEVPRSTSPVSTVPHHSNHPSHIRSSDTRYRPRSGTIMNSETSDDPLRGMRIVCLFNNRHFYKNGFTPAKLEPHLCTHLNYEFAILDPKTYEMITGEPDLDIDMNFYEEAIGLKKINHKLKVLMSLGGWSDSTRKYSDLAADPLKRANFISKAVDFLQKHGFDGLDLAWEYPNCWQGAIGESPKDKPNFVIWLKEIKEEFKQHGLLLSVSVGAIKREVEAAYDVPEISKIVDYINVMTYDMHGPWESKTSHHVQFEAMPGDTDPYCNVKGGMQVWIEKGASKEKLNMGIAFYARTFRLKNPNECGMGIPAMGPGAPGPVSKEGGILSYHEICKFLNAGNWTEKEEKHAGFYACSGDQWAAYDPPMMIVRKVKYVVEYGFGGVLLKDLSGDDSAGECFNMPFPLLKMAKLEMIHKVRQKYS